MEPYRLCCLRWQDTTFFDFFRNEVWDLPKTLSETPKTLTSGRIEMNNTTRALSAFILIAAVVTTTTSPAFAQSIQAQHVPNSPAYRAKVGLNWASASEASVDMESYGMPIAKYDEDIESGAGVTAEFEIPVFNNFTLGPRLVIGSWNSEEVDQYGIDASTMVQLQVVPKLRFPMSNGRVAFYAAVPVGLSALLSSDELSDQGFEGGGGVNGSVLAGVEQYWGSFGIYVEAGLNYNAYTMEYFGPATDFTTVEFNRSHAMVVATAGAVMSF
jgi:hypothetical protein